MHASAVASAAASTAVLRLTVTYRSKGPHLVRAERVTLGRGCAAPAEVTRPALRRAAFATSFSPGMNVLLPETPVESSRVAGDGGGGAHLSVRGRQRAHPRSGAMRERRTGVVTGSRVRRASSPADLAQVRARFFGGAAPQSAPTGPSTHREVFYIPMS